MADIANSTVFTNGGTSDLLRQAFQEVVDDDDRDNEFVAYLQGEGDESQAIHLTHAQASALRLTFEVDAVDDQTDDITYNHEQNIILGDIRGTGDLENEKSTPPHNESMDAMNFQTASTSEIDEVSKVERNRHQEWATQEMSQDEVMETESMSMESLEPADNILDQFSGHRNVRKIYVQQNSARTIKGNCVAANDGKVQFAAGETSARNFQPINALPRSSQAQILQRLPVLLPSSQFIIKPAQTILKSTKNIRILPSTNKVGNLSTINGTVGRNSILLPKGVLDALSPQIIKANPVTTQLINGSTVSNQMLDTSQLLRTNCKFQDRNGNANGTRPAQGLINTPIRLSPAIKTSAGMIQTSNGQQFVIPTLKTNQEGTVLKTVQLSNGNSVKTPFSGQFLKSVQIPAQMLRSANTAFVKTIPASSSSKMTATTSSPIIFQAASLLKTPESKTTTTNVSSASRNSTQNSSTPISILKPQTKGTSCGTNRQNLIIDGQNLVANMQNARFVQKASNCQTNHTNERLRIVQTGLKQKANESTLETARIVKKAKVAGLHNPVALTAEQTDTTKPLGSSENPIQIVQQGHTFHSMQRLTQSQLKQIAHVLQQRSQEAAMPNEKIVYRVVFPEELDLRMRNPGNLVKARGGKRGRPKKTAVRPAAPLVKTPTVVDEEPEETKFQDDRKKVVARTRSGRLSRPPRHMVRDYKHLHHLDFTQPDLDDSDGGYSDYNTNSDKLDVEASPKELLTGLEVPKRKISDHFRCPTCSKIYLGRTRMARHFEMHPDHGSPEQLPPPTPDPELKRAISQDPLKRKGKKRGPWAYVTPEAKSERRQVKLKEAITVCENSEIINIAAKPVLNAQSIYDLLILKSDNNVRTFIDELKNLMNKVREQIGAMLTIAVDVDHETDDILNIHEDTLCDVLGLDPGIYKINNDALRKTAKTFNDDMNVSMNDEPPSKLQKIHANVDCKEILDERMSSGFSESSDMSVSDFLNERKIDLTNANCPEVLTALTLMPRNPTPNSDSEKSNMSKLLISNPEIQNQISENRGFQKIDINSSKSYRKLETLKDGFAKLTESLELANCDTDFTKLNDNYEQTKLHNLQQAFIKLEPIEQGFKLENSTMSAYEKDDSDNYDKIGNDYETMETSSSSFVKGFHKLISKIVPMDENDDNSMNKNLGTTNLNGEKLLRSVCKISDGLPMLQDTSSIMSGSCDVGIFGGNDNLDMSKITGYDHIPHLMMDEKLVEQLHLVDQTNLVDELVSERLKNIMPDNLLENNLLTNGSNIDSDLDFEALSEEFNRNTRS